MCRKSFCINIFVKNKISSFEQNTRCIWYCGSYCGYDLKKIVL